MTEKTDNPRDHSHGDYPWAILTVFVVTIVITVSGWFGTCASLQKRDDRIDSIECRIAPDEAACLRKVLEK